MMSVQIEVQDLWKSYRRGRSSPGTLRHSITNWLNAFGTKKEEFYALQDINFTIQQGDVVGIVGPNGAGKSTLLKLLSRITFPTRGKIIYKGRLSSMLEIGTGFHPDLTGRENIFLNGAIMGMKFAEINRKLDSIIAFSELESFIDTPVKHYSSGMYVRLAFSVAAHLEPDILLIDEVLAVGDQSFRKKCLEKILDVSRQGKTIVMVSHQLSYLRMLCKRGIYLSGGKLVTSGTIDEVIDHYISNTSEDHHNDLMDRNDREGSSICKISSIRFESKEGKILPDLCSGQYVNIKLKIVSSQAILRNVEIRLDCFDFLGRQWFVLNNAVSDGVMRNCPGNVTFNCTIPKLPLNEGRFYMDISVYCNRELSDRVQHAKNFEVEKGNFYTTGQLPLPAKGMLVEYYWSLNDNT